MADRIIDLGEAARRAAAASAAKQAGTPPPAPQMEPQAHPAWQGFMGRMTRLNLLGKMPPKAKRDLLWAGYVGGFEDAIQMVQSSFQTGNFMMEGHPPSWWTELLGLATAVAGCVEEDGYADDLNEKADALATHINTIPEIVEAVSTEPAGPAEVENDSE